MRNASDARATNASGGLERALGTVALPRRSAVAGIAFLSILTLLAGAPALSGSLLAYYDNPIHLSEVWELSREGGTGWSDLGFCGFPLHMLQSPLIFGAMAWAARAGIPLGPVYTLALLAAVAAPAIAFFTVARRRLPDAWALGLASTLIVYRGALVGSAAPLAGMFSFNLASAALLLAADALSRPERSARDVPVLATLTALVGLTHMYVTIALVWVAVIHAAWSLKRGRTRRLLYDAPAMALGAAAAAAYWMPNALARTTARSWSDPVFRALSRLITTTAPLPPPDLHGVARILWDPVFQLDALPQLAVLVLGIAGFRGALRDVDDDAPIYGATLFCLFCLLLSLTPYTHHMLLGPQGTRQIYVVKLGLLLGSIPAAQALSRRFPLGLNAERAVMGVAALFALLSMRLVASESVPRSEPDLASLESMWSFIEHERNPSWGRVFLLSTFGVPDTGRLATSHIMPRTGEHAGVEQVGAYYGNMPYDREWFYEGALGLDGTSAEGVERTLTLMRRSNSTHAILTDPRVFPLFERDPRFELVTTIGRFALVAVRGAVSTWASVTGGAGGVAVERQAPGRMQLTVEPGVERISLKESFHPFWRAQGAGFTLRADSLGLMELVRTAPGGGPLILVYTRPGIPRLVSFAAVAGIGLTFVVVFARRRRATPAASTQA